MDTHRAKHLIFRKSCLAYACLLATAYFSGCSSYRPQRRLDTHPSGAQNGLASWYGSRFDGRKTASGQIFSKHALTAAHRTLPFGTIVRVTNRNNGRQVIVTINDRGPHRKGRIIDLSEAAAKRIGLLKTGLAPVRIEVLRLPQPP